MKPGQWVTSTAGRDRGRHYIVSAVDGGQFLWVVDGKVRKLAHPKRKNLRHVWVHDAVDSQLASRFEKGERVTDDEIRAAVAELAGVEEEVS